MGSRARSSSPHTPGLELGPASCRRLDASGRRTAIALALVLVVVVLVALAFYTGRSSAGGSSGAHRRPTTAAASPAEPAPAAVRFWTAVARCETGGRWRGLGSTYQGGLGIYWQTWDWWARELGVLDRYPDAGDAPALVQIRVADLGYRLIAGRWPGRCA